MNRPHTKYATTALPGLVKYTGWVGTAAPRSAAWSA